MLKERLIVGIGVLAWLGSFLAGIAFIASLVSGDLFLAFGALGVFVPAILIAGGIEWVARTMSNNDEQESETAPPQHEASSHDDGSSEAPRKSIRFRVLLNLLLALVFGAGAVHGVYTVIKDPSSATTGWVFGEIVWICLLYWTIRELFALRKRTLDSSQSDDSSAVEGSHE